MKNIWVSGGLKGVFCVHGRVFENYIREIECTFGVTNVTTTQQPLQTLYKDILQRFRFSFSLVSESAPPLVRWLIVISIFQSLLPLTTVYLLKVLIDAVTAAAQSDNPDIQGVIFLVMLTGGAFLLVTVLDTGKVYVHEKLKQHFIDHIYSKIHKTTTQIEVSYFEDDAYYNLFSRAIQNADSKPLQVVNSSLSMLQFAISIVTLGLLLITLHWTVPLLLLVAAMPLGLTKIYYSRAIYRWYQSNTQNERKIWDVNDVLTNAYFSREIRLFGLTKYFRGVFEQLRNFVRESYFQLLKRRTIVETLSLLFATIAVFGALGYISMQTIAGVLTVGGLAMYVMAIHRGMTLFQDLLKSLAALYEDGLYIDYIRDFLALRPEESEGENKGKDHLSFPKKLQTGINFSNIHFRYPKSERNALTDVSLHIPAGKTVAIVGVNGAGKTTLVKLLCGLYQPDSGSITFDDVSIGEMTKAEVRKNIAVLFQNFARYNFSVRENIWFGNPDFDPTDAAIRDAAEKAQAQDLIDKLPRGYETILGKIYAQSEDISTGEWQKIGLARAFFKDSPVVVLDEPTSALDPESEYAIFKLFAEITKDKTALLITHRFSSVRMADYIYVMDKEHIAEHGTHEDLLAKGGRYAAMFAKQSEGYR
ncbi:MAG: ABC transporter ATP-binding protein [Cryomorphaceae bacterium]|nr:ABC transporter ATP-binding protein [Cryomorphaceae bacterium]